MSLDNGTQKINALNCGISLTEKNILVNILEFFPISNWTELDVWQYMGMENIQLPSLYYAHTRPCVVRNGIILAISEFVQAREGEAVKEMQIRFRTMGDATITGAYVSDADTIDKIIQEVAAARETERGNRTDDKRSETAMEDRKKEGYFKKVLNTRKRYSSQFLLLLS
jgi:sulfate adenylyltransferase subunit 2